MTTTWRDLERRPANEVVFAHWDRPEHTWPTDPPGTQRDPYLHAGSHPDCVERVWDGLGSTLPEDCRFLVLGRPVLAHPVSGAVFAMPYGTSYAIRIPGPQHADATAAGLMSTTTWSGGSVTDLEDEFGAGWFFGRFVDDEAAWITAAYAAAATPASRPW